MHRLQISEHSHHAAICGGEHLARLGVALLACLAAAGCTANVGSDQRQRVPLDGNNASGGSVGTTGTGGVGNTAAGGASPSTGAQPSGATACAPEASLAPARIWRVTDAQYVNVVRDVFGASINAEVSGAQGANETLNLADAAGVNASNASNYQASARVAAQKLASNLATLLPCASATPDANCVDQFIRTTVARAYRRPLTETEVTELLALYNLGATDGPQVGVRVVLESVLQSANFLWRTELGPELATPQVGTKVNLTPSELAAAMSFFLNDSVPDASLWGKAVDGSLQNPALLATEVDRLLTLPDVRTRLTGDAKLWLGMGRLEARPKDATLFPEFTATAKDALLESGLRFVGNVMWNGQFSELFTTKKMFLNQELGALYGIAGANGTALTELEVSTPERSAGILSQPIILAAHASPSTSDVVHRGLFVFRSLVCGATIPKPPANAVRDALAALPADSTEKQFANFRAQNPSCQGCHSGFDSLGLVQERYDALGRYQASDAQGQPIDESATIVGLGADIDGPTVGVRELAGRLQTARRVADCAVTSFSTIALGQSAQQDNSCALRAVQDSFASSGSFADLFRALLSSPGFATRDVK